MEINSHKSGAWWWQCCWYTTGRHEGCSSEEPKENIEPICGNGSQWNHYFSNEISRPSSETTATLMHQHRGSVFSLRLWFARWGWSNLFMEQIDQKGGLTICREDTDLLTNGCEMVRWRLLKFNYIHWYVWATAACSILKNCLDCFFFFFFIGEPGLLCSFTLAKRAVCKLYKLFNT